MNVMKNVAATKYLASAINLIDNAGLRAHLASKKEVLLPLARNAIAHNHPPIQFSTYIYCLAMGL